MKEAGGGAARRDRGIQCTLKVSIPSQSRLDKESSETNEARETSDDVGRDTGGPGGGRAGRGRGGRGRAAPSARDQERENLRRESCQAGRHSGRGGGCSRCRSSSDTRRGGASGSGRPGARDGSSAANRRQRSYASREETHETLAVPAAVLAPAAPAAPAADERHPVLPAPMVEAWL